MRLLLLAYASLTLVASSFGDNLQPMLSVPAEVVVNDTFDRPHKLDKAVWQQRQGTLWAIEDGVLRGRESSADYQAKKSHHRGLEPRLSMPTTPDEFAARFSVRFLNGTANAIVPFVEFGHHVCRVRFHENGLELLAEGESLIVARTKELTYEPGHWYHCLAELKDGHFVMQIADGPTLYAFHESFKQPPTSGGKGFGVAGPQHGQVEINNLEIRHIRNRDARGWEQAKAGLATIKPIVIEKKRQQFLAKQKASQKQKDGGK